QIRLGDRQDTRGTAFVVYDDIYDAKAAVDHLSCFNVCGRYLIVLYYQARPFALFIFLSPAKMAKRMDQQAKKKELEELRQETDTPKLKVAREEDAAGDTPASK
ncbi:unnamed protein product, partial [Ectocarpus sp. 12 AP-2014]